jgi:type I site-specific restriction endonuclease
MNELRTNGSVKHQIIAAACSIDHAKAIRSLYAERNLKADVIHSHMDSTALERVRSDLANQRLDAIVQVQMLGEGADYPTLGVAAIFRPFRHMVPYVQFIGRIMRVIRQGAPGHPDNRGFVVSHVGLNVDRWWDELKNLDEGDQLVFKELASSERDFSIASSKEGEQRRFRHPMEVLEEIVERFVEVGFLPEARDALVDDVVHALSLRGIGLEILGLDRQELGKRIEQQASTERTGTLLSIAVQPQKQRQETRRRLNERVRSAASEVLKRCGVSIVGFDLPRMYPELGSRNNLGAAIVLLNQQVQKFLGTSSAERDLLALEELERAYRGMDNLVEKVVADVNSKRG